jgi:hypothetical protein
VQRSGRSRERQLRDCPACSKRDRQAPEDRSGALRRCSHGRAAAYHHGSPHLNYEHPAMISGPGQRRSCARLGHRYPGPNQS